MLASGVLQPGRWTLVASLPATEFVRKFLPVIGAVVGLFAGLFLGAIAGLCIVVIVLSATGHPHPIASIDGAFASRPMGLPALVISTTYIVTTILGAVLLYRAARRFALRLQPLPYQDYSTQRAQILARWRSIRHARRALLVALFILTAAVSWPFFFYYQQTIKHASRVPTTERPVSINDHGHELYVTSAQKHLISGWSFAMFAVTFSTLGYALYTFRFSQLVSQLFRTRPANDRNA